MSTILTPATSTAGAETSGQVFRNPLIPPQSRIPQFGL
jgi:hypothetical protein